MPPVETIARPTPDHVAEAYAALEAAIIAGQIRDASMFIETSSSAGYHTLSLRNHLVGKGKL